MKQYAAYLKKKHKKMSVIPNNWPPNLSTPYTTLALIETGSTKKSSATMEYDYIHGKVDNIIACKKQIRLDEVVLPIINQ